MLFNSLEFIFIFLPLALIVFYGGARFLKPHFGRNVLFAVLTLASLIFYSYWYWPNIFVLLTSIIINYNIGCAIQNRNRQLNAKMLAAFGVAGNLAVLGYFKYLNFFAENIAFLSGDDHSIIKIMMPLGISFFTFQQIAYVVDSYKNKVRSQSIFDYALFVSFFPQLIAGPIVLYDDIKKQYSSPEFGSFNALYFVMGLMLFTLGLSKKVLLADNLSLISQPVFATADAGGTLQFFEAWAGALAYTYQLYFDFSGYSDMAIGLALLFGLKLPINFDSPYKSTSIIEFWCRWHITFSNFLRDYLYIPLGGSKNGRSRTAVNLLIVMFLGGLWHGAGWTFVIWGLMHGLFLVINHTYRTYLKAKGRENGIFSFPPLAYLMTMFSVMIGWIFFRAETFSGAFNVIKTMFGQNLILMPSEVFNRIPGGLHGVFLPENESELLYWTGALTWDAFPFIIAVAFSALLLPSSTSLYRRIKDFDTGKEAVGTAILNPVFGLYLGIVFILSVLMTYANAASEFLYFQF